MRKKLMKRRLRKSFFPLVLGSLLTMAMVGFSFVQLGKDGGQEGTMGRIGEADIYFDTHGEAVHYGRRKKDVYLYLESNP